MRTSRVTLLALVAGLSTCSFASAALVTNVGSWTFDGNTTGNRIPVYVTGGDLITGATIVAQLGNVDPGDPSSLLPGPSITFDLTGTIFDLPGTVFGSAATGSPQVALATALLDLNQNATGNGLIATVVVDTTGFDSGTYTLTLESLAGDFTDFSGTDSESLSIGFTYTAGSVTVAIPEPQSLALLIPTLSLLRRRR